MGSRKYLVIFHAVSSGQNGPLLGADEQEIVLLVYLVLDVINNKVRQYSWLPGTYQYLPTYLRYLLFYLVSCEPCVRCL